MRFSKKSEYALRALIELTAQYGKDLVQRHDIARRQHIPVEFLEQILLALKNAGLLASRRGVSGGYSLIKPPQDITLGQIIRLLDGPLAPIGCVSKTAYQKCHDCPYADRREQPCPIQDVMLNVRNAIADILDNYTLSDFAKQSQRKFSHADHPTR
jgi:Rrf2 family transcriptional regulator, cysteine metabolism repressor